MNKVLMNKNSSENLLPTIFVILGATGDLMQKKLAPALFHLYREGNLPTLFEVVGFSKDELSEDAFRVRVADMVQAKVPDTNTEQLESFVRVFRYQQGLFEDEKGYEAVASMLGRQDGVWNVCSNKLFYIAASPQFYETIFRKLAKSKLTEPCSPEEGWTRVIVEKPFGKDLQTAQELDALLGKLFKEEQIYRIDHYLGKETVQNVLAFRFSNSFLQDSWNNQAIERITISLFEREGVGGRGGFYEGVGALRDVGQNHMLQLLALFLMENPGSFEADAVRKERAVVLRAIKKLGSQEIQRTTVRGQYEGYRQEKGVQPNSQTETYFALQAVVDTLRWRGVPVHLQSGKAMKEDRVEVKVLFRHPALCLCPEGKHYQNTLRYGIQPKEGIEITFLVKKPGPEMILEEKEFTFGYKEAFEGQEISDAYERLLFSVVKGDQTLFVSTEEIEAEWKFIDPIVRAWQKNEVPLEVYKKNTNPS